MSRLHLLNAATLADRECMAEVAVVFGEREAGLARFQERANGAPWTRCATSTTPMCEPATPTRAKGELRGRRRAQVGEVHHCACFIDLRGGRARR